MPERLFRRSWRVTIDTLDCGALDVRFKVHRTLASRAGTLELEVYNLTEAHRAEAQRFHRRGGTSRHVVRVEAGYESNRSVLFQGNIREVYNSRTGPEWITKVLAADGLFAYRGARVLRSFGASTSLADVVRAMAAQMDVGVGNLDPSLSNTTVGRLSPQFSGGSVVHGRADRELTRMLNAAGLEWSVQAGVLQVLPAGHSLGREAILLDAEHGMIESPTLSRNRVASVKALLIPELVPGRKVRIESGVVSGFYRIDETEFSGDTRGTDWYASITARPLWRVAGFTRPIVEE